METLVVLGLILGYAAFVIYKRIKAIRKGNYCSCNCSGCPSGGKCKSLDKE